MSFPTLNPENKALNLLDSAVTLFPDLKPGLREWTAALTGSIARSVPAPEGLEELADEQHESMDRETYLLASALCTYRDRVYAEGTPVAFDPEDAARDDLESAMSRFEERLARAKPKVELDNAPDAGDYAEEAPPRDEPTRLSPDTPGLDDQGLDDAPDPTSDTDDRTS